jgi:FkbM family methyltransferase
LLRQIRNLIRVGRFRTAARTPRIRKPEYLRRHPDKEIGNLLGLVTARYGRDTADFSFVQVGAFNGRTGDPLFDLIKRYRWRGILVEPQLDAFEELQRNYADQPQLQFFNVVIAPTDGEVSFYTRKSGSVQHASLTRELLITPSHPSSEILERRVQALTITTLLQKAGAPSTIDLLQIDAEGHDYEIVRSIDFQRVKPTIIRYEHSLLSPRDGNACLALLASHGYRFLLEDADTTAVLETGP